MKMQSTQMLKFFSLLLSSSILFEPCYGASPLTPTEIEQNQSPITLQETLERAYMQNAALDAARAELRSTDENVSQANAAWRPSLSVTGNQNLSQTNPIGPGPNQRGSTTGYTAQIDQNVYQGGGSEANLARQEATVLAGKANLFSTEQTTLTNAVFSHTDVIAKEEILTYQKRSEEFYRINLERVRAQFEVGENTYTDVALMEGRYEDAKANVAGALRDLETAKAVYLNQIGSPPEKLAPANLIIDVPKEYEEVLEVAKIKNPSIIQAQYTLDAAQYFVRVQQSQLLPSVDLSATVGNQRNQSNTSLPEVQKSTNFGFQTRVTVPIYPQGGSLSSLVRQAYQTVAQNKVQLVGAQRQVEQDAKSAWEALIAARENVKSRLASVKAQQLAVEGGVEEVAVGTKSMSSSQISSKILFNNKLN